MSSIAQILQLKPEVLEQNCVWLFYYFKLERNDEVLKWKSPCILLNKKLNFNKTKWNGKWKVPYKVLHRRTFSFISFKNRKFFSEGEFFKICVLSQRIVYKCAEYTFRIYMFLHTKKHYSIHFNYIRLNRHLLKMELKRIRYN